MAQSSSYKLPPQAVVDIIDAAPAPGISFSPDREWMLLVDRDAMPDIGDVSRRMLALAGMRIDPTSNGPFQTSFNRGITLVKRDDLLKNNPSNIRMKLPVDVKISRITWSHNSKYFSFAVVTDQGATTLGCHGWRSNTPITI